MKTDAESKPDTEAGDWRMSAVICRGYLHLLLCFVVQQPEKQRGDKGLKGIANSQEITRGLSIKFKFQT